MDAIKSLEEQKAAQGIPYRRLCLETHLPYGSLMRWMKSWQNTAFCP